MVQHMPLSVRVPIELDNPSIRRNEDLCIKCGQCRDVCTNAIGVLGTYSLSQTGGNAICIHCGQCSNVCPTASITEVYEYPDVAAAIRDPEKIVIVSTSPSVRVALGEEFGMAKGSFVQGKMVALLRVCHMCSTCVFPVVARSLCSCCWNLRDLSAQRGLLVPVQSLNPATFCRPWD